MAHKPVLNIINHQRNGNQNWNDGDHATSVRRPERRSNKAEAKPSPGADEEKPICNHHHECDMRLLLWKTSWQRLKALKMELPRSLGITDPAIYPREMKSYLHVKPVTQWLQELYMERSHTRNLQHTPTKLNELTTQITMLVTI